MMYQLLCAEYPFHDEDYGQLVDYICNDSCRFNQPAFEQVPEGAKHCIEAMLNKDPSKRIKAHDVLSMPFFMDAADDGQAKPEEAVQL